MRPFISLPKKIMMLLLVLLLALGGALYQLWISKTDHDFLLKQQEIRQQNQKQYLLLNEMLRNRMESWLELFAQLHENRPDQIEAMADTLSSEFEFLQLHWQVENIWLVDQRNNLVFFYGPLHA